MSRKRRYCTANIQCIESSFTVLYPLITEDTVLLVSVFKCYSYVCLLLSWDLILSVSAVAY
jgi:hypothetical protein